MTEAETEFLISEYEQLCEEIRDYNRSGWQLWMFYFTVSGVLLGVAFQSGRNPDGSLLSWPMAFVGLLSTALGVLTIMSLSKFSFVNRADFKRLAAIEAQWKISSRSTEVGKRWNERYYRGLLEEANVKNPMEWWLSRGAVAIICFVIGGWQVIIRLVNPDCATYVLFEVIWLSLIFPLVLWLYLLMKSRKK